MVTPERGWRFSSTCLWSRVSVFWASRCVDAVSPQVPALVRQRVHAGVHGHPVLTRPALFDVAR
jgi:hypothetical protein